MLCIDKDSLYLISFCHFQNDVSFQQLRVVLAENGAKDSALITRHGVYFGNYLNADNAFKFNTLGTPIRHHSNPIFWVVKCNRATQFIRKTTVLV